MGKGRDIPRGLSRPLRGSAVPHSTRTSQVLLGCYNLVAVWRPASRQAGPERDNAPSLSTFLNRGNSAGQSVVMGCVPGLNDTSLYYLRRLLWNWTPILFSCNRRTLRITWPNSTLSTTNTTRTDLGASPNNHNRPTVTRNNFYRWVGNS
jgi:hypothetical protein